MNRIRQKRAPRFTPALNLLNFLRDVRDAAPAIKRAQRVLREPWYRTLELLFPSGVPARLSSGDSVRLQPRFLGMQPEEYEKAVATRLIEYLHPGATVVDVGAHVGLHTIMFSLRVGSEGCVLAVEPSPANARMLRLHAMWNACHNVEVIEAAVGDRVGLVSFSFQPDPTNPGGFANSLAYDVDGATTTVQMTTIDTICANRIPHLIKIDVEGAELLALRGAESILRLSAPTLVVAIHPEPMRQLGTSQDQLLTFLEQLGYRGYHLDGRCARDPGFEELVFQKL